MPGQPTEEVALRWLRETLRHLAWRRPGKTSPDVAVDIVGRGSGGQRVAVTVKRLHGPNRVDLLKGAAAMGVLELRGQPEGTVKLVCLFVDRLGAQVVDKLGAYLLDFAPEVAWMVIDGHGGARAHIPEFGIDTATESDAPAATPRSHSIKLFRDLNAWMLKVLLMRGAPEWAWTATRQPSRNPRALATVAGVSDATAHRFVKVMTDADYLRQRPGRLQLIRVESLLRSWRAAHQAHPPRMIEARPLFELTPEQWGDSVLGKRMALGGEFAASHFDLRHATRGRRTVWVEGDPESALDVLDLVAASPGDGQVWVGRPRHPESCFRARVVQAEQAFVDPIELMLESALDPTRGAEQSDYLLDRILTWQTDEAR